eukprot:scaffold633_cov288-Ochromonas_danica.AAC.96
MVQKDRKKAMLLPSFQQIPISQSAVLSTTNLLKGWMQKPYPEMALILDAIMLLYAACMHLTGQFTIHCSRNCCGIHPT